eukprot:m.51486 g.51486  ORF g.51486 m.51486 type:complete len:87 (-) comp7312_c0_seq1:502-762(-)
MGLKWRRGNRPIVIAVAGSLLLAALTVRLRHHKQDMQPEQQQPDPFIWQGHPEGLYALSARDIDGVDVPLAKYMGRVSVVVNVASF